MASAPTASELRTAVEEVVAATGFSGAVRVDRAGETLLDAAWGLADRAAGVANTPTTRFAAASVTKLFTALTVLSLVEDGVLGLHTTARSLLGDDLPLVDDAVTVEHLLAHRSGIGDYLDEEQLDGPDDYVMPVPVHRLDAAESYLAVLDGHPQVSPPGERFAYNNGGYVVLAILAERAAGEPYHSLVERRVCELAGLRDTGFPRSDEPAAGTAVGYLWPDRPRTNVLHLPVVGVGDGGIATTTADLHALWSAVLGGRVVSPSTAERMTTRHSLVDDGRWDAGLGLFLHRLSDGLMTEGMDAGISARSVHHPSTDTTYTVLANASDGAWPVVIRLAELLTP